MDAALAVVVAGLALALAVVLVVQRRTVRRLVAAARRLEPEVVPTGTGLAEATSVVERAVDRALLRGGDTTVAERRLKAALAVLPLGVVVFDRGGEIVHRNRIAGDYLGGRHGDALVDEAIAELGAAALRRRGGDGPIPTRTLELFGPPRRTLVLRGVPLDDQPVSGAVVVVEDVTERRRLESIRRDFVANVSHELKTPVGALGLLAETLLAEDDPAVVRRLASRLVDEAFRVSRTIDDLLELSRIETEEGVEREELPVAAVLAEAVDRVRGAADTRAVELAVEETAPRLTVVGDRRQLVSAAYNLLDNAVKYSDAGSVVHVRTRTDGRWVDLDVEDHGIGIPPRDLDRVFERFYRVDPGRSRDTGGTGLGLAIVRHVADNHGGVVRVRSREGVGSTFTLRLPLAGEPVAVAAEAG